MHIAHSKEWGHSPSIPDTFLKERDSAIRSMSHLCICLSVEEPLSSLLLIQGIPATCNTSATSATSATKSWQSHAEEEAFFDGPVVASTCVGERGEACCLFVSHIARIGGPRAYPRRVTMKVTPTNHPASCLSGDHEDPSTQLSLLPRSQLPFQERSGVSLRPCWWLA